MAIRISTQTLHDAIATTIGQRNQKILSLQMGLSDGRAVRAPSDDPVRVHQAMWFREQLRSNGQYERNIQGVLSSLQNTEGVLTGITELLNQARQMQVTGADDSTGTDGRLSLADSVNELIESLVALANDRSGGTYTFSGRQSLQVPFAIERDANGRVTDVRLNPMVKDDDVLRRVSSDVSLTINVTAADLFGEDGAFFETLIGLRDALAADDGDGIRGREDALDAGLERIMRSTSRVGALMVRAEALLGRVGTERISYEDGRSKAEDLDVARALVDLQQEQIALQAALESGSRILNLNLLDYLR